MHHSQTCSHCCWLDGWTHFNLLNYSDFCASVFVWLSTACFAHDEVDVADLIWTKKIIPFIVWSIVFQKPHWLAKVGTEVFVFWASAKTFCCQSSSICLFWEENLLWIKINFSQCSIYSSNYLVTLPVTLCAAFPLGFHFYSVHY